MVVCPIYQLPGRTSQIYFQAIARNVCIFSYAHLAVLICFRDLRGPAKAQALLLQILKCAEAMKPTKDAVAYWTNLNRTMLNFDNAVSELWSVEEAATLEAIRLAKEEALTFLASERKQIMGMSRQEAIRSLIRLRNLDGRATVVRAGADNGILAIS